jgi:hypothetical protein
MRIRSILGGGAITAALALALVAGQQPASAAGPFDQAAAAASADRAGAGSLTAGAARVDVSRSRPSVAVTAGEHTLWMDLFGAANGVQSQVGTTIYHDVGRSTDAQVRALGEGTVQMLTLMRDASAPTTQRYQLHLPAGTQLRAFGGGYLLVDAAGRLTGQIAAPWAKDATGRSLPTRYIIDRDVLVQQTDTAGAAYPVVADPKLTFGRSIYLNLWGYELRGAAIAAIAIGGYGAAVSCTLIGKIPNGILRTIAALMCSTGIVNVKAVFNAILDTYFDRSINDGSCYQDNILSVATYFVVVGSSNCS